MPNRVTEMDTGAHNTQGETVMSVYQEGYQAYSKGVLFACCPHNPGRPSYSEWVRGWIQADTDRYRQWPTASS